MHTSWLQRQAYVENAELRHAADDGDDMALLTTHVPPVSYDLGGSVAT